MASGFGAESWGIGPFTSHLNNLIFACGVTYALRVLALPQKTTSALPKEVSPLAASSERLRREGFVGANPTGEPITSGLSVIQELSRFEKVCGYSF
jgi:hypothetical protein